jgi:hypothetical protein
MRKICVLLWLLMVISVAGFAQQTVPPPASSSVQMAAQPVPDSVRQVLHKLFKRGRLFGTISAISGGLMVGGAVSYIARDDDDWSTGVNLALGVNSLAMGTISMVRFSRRQERKLMAALEQGQPLPPYVANWMPLIPPKGKKK